MPCSSESAARNTLAWTLARNFFFLEQYPSSYPRATADCPKAMPVARGEHRHALHRRLGARPRPRNYCKTRLGETRTLGGTLGGSTSMSALESSTAASGDGPGRLVSPCPNPDSNPDPDSNPNPDLMTLTTSLRHISRAGLAARAGLLAVCDSGKWQLEAAALRRPPTRALVGDRAMLITRLGDLLDVAILIH